jgi:hypothetical protein
MANWIAETYGIIGWKGDPEEFRRLALAHDSEDPFPLK